MSERNLIYQDKEYNYYKNEFISYSNEFNINDLNTVLSNKSSFYITNQNHSKHIKLKSLSLKIILSKGELEPNEHILFCYYKDKLPSMNEEEEDKNYNINKINNKQKLRAKKRKKDKSINEDINEYENNKDKEDDVPQNSHLLNESRDKLNNILLDVSNKKENIFDPNLPLLKNRTSNTFKNYENLQRKYINLILCNNYITINIDYLKLFYLIIFICGLFNFIYFFDILFDKDYSSANVYHIFCFPLSFLLIITGIYGYKKVKENIYDNEICIYLTNISFIASIFSFIFSRISMENYIKRKLIFYLFINLISCFLSLLCKIILKEIENEKYLELEN